MVGSGCGRRWRVVGGRGWVWVKEGVVGNGG